MRSSRARRAHGFRLKALTVNMKRQLKGDARCNSMKFLAMLVHGVSCELQQVNLRSHNVRDSRLSKKQKSKRTSKGSVKKPVPTETCFLRRKRTLFASMESSDDEMSDSGEGMWRKHNTWVVVKRAATKVAQKRKK